jgi:hypothetical protein
MEFSPESFLMTREFAIVRADLIAPMSALFALNQPRTRLIGYAVPIYHKTSGRASLKAYPYSELADRIAMGESFFQRWARRKAEHEDGDSAPEKTGPVAVRGSAKTPAGAPGNAPADADSASLPTLDDVMQLTRESDYSLFVSPGIDKSVRRAAMKKLFSDPHFNVMDRLDIYIDDYTKPSPMSPAMLAGLKHTQSLFAAVAKQVAEREEAQRAEAARLESESMAQHDDAVGEVAQEVQAREANEDVPDSAGFDAIPKEVGHDVDGMHAARGNS